MQLLTLHAAKLEKIPDLKLRSSFSNLLQAPNVTDAHQIMLKSWIHYVMAAGTMKVMRTKADVDNVVQLTINWHVLGRCKLLYSNFKEGLQALGILEAISAHPKLFRDVLCYRSECLTAVVMESIFKVIRSEGGSNQRNAESLVLSNWNDVLQGAEENPIENSLAEILFFASGCKILPPWYAW